VRTFLIAIALLVARTADARDCVPADATVDSSEIRRDHAIVCYDRCWKLDYATGTWTPVAAPAAHHDLPEPASKVAFATKVHVCAPDCRDVLLPGISPLNDTDVVESADRSLIAVRGPSSGNADPIFVFNAIAGTLLTTIQPWKTEMGDPATFQRVKFVGKTVFVAISSTPVTTQGRLYNPLTGRQLGEVGGHGAELDDSVAIDLGGNRWVFAAFDNHELFIYDVANGKRVASIRSGPKDGGYSALELAGKRLVGVRDSARAGVMLYDVDAHKATQHVVPRCE